MEGIHFAVAPSYSREYNGERIISGNNSMDAVFLLKLTDSAGSPFFGPGVAELFTLIDETGSVRHASEKMGLSYSKAWKMIRGTEKAIGKEAVVRTQGGKGGGKAELTESGKALLDLFISMEKEMRQHLAENWGGYLEKF